MNLEKIRACLKSLNTLSARTFICHTLPLFLDMHKPCLRKIDFIWRKNAGISSIPRDIKFALGPGEYQRICTELTAGQPLPLSTYMESCDNRGTVQLPSAEENFYHTFSDSENNVLVACCITNIHQNVHRAELKICCRTGIGPELFAETVQQIAQWAKKDHDIDILYVQVQSDNHAMTELLQHQGFRWTHNSSRVVKSKRVNLSWYALLSPEAVDIDPLHGKKIVFFIQSPKAVGGGSIVLMDYSASLADDYGYNVYFANYANPKLDRYYTQSNLHFCNARTDDFSQFSDAVFFTPVNYIFYLLSHIKNLSQAKICTYFYHPQVLSWMKSGQIPKVIYSEKNFASFMQLLAERKAACFMDKSNYLPANEMNQGRFEEVYIPVIADNIKRVDKLKKVSGGKKLRVGWLGRLDMDKIYSLTNFLENTRLLSTDTKIEFHIIGDGNARNRINLKKYASKVQCVFTSYLYGEERDEYLLNHCDLCIAMGISATVCGTLGIPTIVPIVSPRPFSGNEFVYLFDCVGYSLGWNAQDIKAMGLHTHKLQEVFDDVFGNDGAKRKELGEKCRAFVEKNFSTENAVPKLLDALHATRLTVADCLKNPIVKNTMRGYGIYSRFKKNENYENYHKFISKTNNGLLKTKNFNREYLFRTILVGLLLALSCATVKKSSLFGKVGRIYGLVGDIFGCLLATLLVIGGLLYGERKYTKKLTKNGLKAVPRTLVQRLEKRPDHIFTVPFSKQCLAYSLLIGTNAAIMLALRADAITNLLSVFYLCISILLLAFVIVAVIAIKFFKTGKFRKQFMEHHLRSRKRKRDRLLAKQKKGKERIRVLFYISLGSLWNTYEEIYKAMQKDPRFEPIILAVPQFIRNEMTDYNILAFLQEKDLKYIKAYNEETGRLLDLRELKPDYIMTNRCYMTVRPPQYCNEEISKFAKVVYIPYTTCMASGHTMDVVCRFQENKYADFVFVANEWMQHMYEGQQKKEPGSDVRIIASGSPKFDAVYLRSKTQNTSDRKYDQIILYTPRWSDFIDKTCSFYILKDYFIDLAKSHPNIKFIFRPHPMMYAYMEDKTIWDSYLAELDSYENTEIDLSGDYRVSYDRATVLVSDLSSMLLEFTVTQKPILYYHKRDVFNAFGNSVARSFYFCDSVEDVDFYLRELREKRDSKAQIRQTVLEEDFALCDGHVAERILGTLIQDYSAL